MLSNRAIQHAFNHYTDYCKIIPRIHFNHLHCTSNKSCMAYSLSSYCQLPRSNFKFFNAKNFRSFSVNSLSSPITYEEEQEFSDLVEEVHEKMVEKETDLALELLDDAEAKGLFSKFPQLWIQKGIVFFELGDAEESLNALNRGIEEGQRSIDAFSYRAMSLTFCSRHEEALLDFDRALEIDPHALHVHLDKGRCLTSLERFDQALETFEKCLTLHPSSYEARKDKARVLSLMNRFEAALKIYDECSIENPHDMKVLIEKLNCLGLLSRYDEALKVIEYANEIQPGHFDLMSHHASILTLLNRAEEALKICDELLEMDPSNPSNWIQKSNALIKMENYDGALQAVERALQLGADEKFHAEILAYKERLEAKIQNRVISL